MTPKEIRQALSKKILTSLVSATLQKLPSIAGVEGFDVERYLPTEAFQYKPTNTIGLLVDRVYVELPEEPTMEQIDTVLIEQILDTESAIYPTMESLSTKMASAISSTYGALRDSIIPAAEDICDTISQKLGEHSALGAASVPSDTTVVMFDWGVLKDPMVVTQALTLAREKANVFDEGQPLRAYEVNTLFTQAGKMEPTHRIVGEERTRIEQGLKAELGDAHADVGQLLTFFTSPEGFRCFHTNMRPQFHQASTVTQASDTIQNLHLVAEKLYSLSRQDDMQASDEFKANLANGTEAVALLAATLHAARKVFYKDAFILDGALENHHVTTLVLNLDHKLAADVKNVSAKNCADVVSVLASESVNIGDRGISLEVVEKERDRSTSLMEDRSAKALQARLGQDSRVYYGVVENAVSKQISEMVKVFKPKLRGRNIGEEIRNIAVSAVRNEGNTFDAVTRLGVSLLQNPSMERMLSSMDAVEMEDTDEAHRRCEAFTRFAVQSLAGPALVE